MKSGKICLFIALMVLLSYSVSGCSFNSAKEEIPPEVVDPSPVIPEEPTDAVQMVLKDLSSIANIDDFLHLTEVQREMLLENGFFVIPSEDEQLFYIYEYNEYQNVPSFITVDSVLQVYHIFYDYTLRTLEEELLADLSKEMTDRLLVRSIQLYQSISDPVLLKIQGRNVAFFGVAQKLFKQPLPDSIPDNLLKLIDSEYRKIMNKEGFALSSVFPFEIDYSQYQVRGHYTRSDNLGDYFLAMMWYGQVPMPLYKDKDFRDEEMTKQALLITKMVVENDEILNAWEKIYKSTAFFVGNSDDLTIRDYEAIVETVFERNFDPVFLNEKRKLNEFYKEEDKLPEPKIKARYADIDTPVGKQFRFMGQRYIMDSQIIQELVYPILRPIPSGLDVMAVLGSERAKEIQLADIKNQDWADYPAEMDRLREEFSHYDESDWKSNMYTGWMWVLKELIEPAKKEYPYFMKNDAWIDKSLNTALGSWSELRHDTVLYGKQSGAEMGGEEIQHIVGYVEPNIEAYKRLLWLTDFSRELLADMDVEIEDIDIKMERFEWLLDFLITASEKQLRGEALTEEEYYRIRIYGGILEDLTSSFAKNGLRWFEITSETDKNMAVIADFHTVGRDGIMHAGVGPAYKIYVAAPIEGKFYLTRGAVFSFHEFMSDVRLTDEMWQQALKEGNAPPMPEWTNSFIR
ncbi:MAG: DUF3160 domain-containing protein [Gudongella sp.]|nr:DUF3160 domain-containing protein [Gudongella sp.]